MKKVLSIAGSDPTGGAGILADMKTFSAFQVYGLGVVTAVTAQDRRGVRATLRVSAPLVLQQLRCLTATTTPDAIKTGMLLNPAIVKAVSLGLRERRPPVIVVDPVMFASRGGQLLNKTGLTALKRELLPLATLVTPNLIEAEMLSGLKVTSVKEMAEAARRIEGQCGCQVLVKGGHLAGKAIDLFYDGKRITQFSLPRIKGKGDVHGTGCAFSSAVAAGLARGLPLHSAIGTAKEYVWIGIKEATLAFGILLFNHHKASAALTSFGE